MVIVIVALGGAAWWGLVQRGAAPVHMAQTSVVDTSNWKTYRNDQYGFEIKYPDYFHETKVYVSTIGNQATLVFGEDSIEYETRRPARDLGSFDFPMLDPATSTDAWILRMRSFETVGHTATDRCEKTKIDFYEGAWCEGFAVDESLVSEVWRAYFMQTPRGGFVAWSGTFFGYYNKSTGETLGFSKTEQQEFFFLVEQILSTFKFTK